ncbi:MAG: phosphodiester glycosidase family protein [Synergistota bacterium]|nr:phosphodiester glycosidase family protein [Synergistota bacterium]
MHIRQLGPCRRKALFLVAAFLLVFCLKTQTPASAQPKTGISRAEAIHHIIGVLGLPRWSGGGHYSDLSTDHPYAASVETAAALGLLHPTKQFYPDLQVMRAEAVMFSLQAMGMGKEAAILGRLCPPDDPVLPDWVSTWVEMARGMVPSPPSELIEEPEKPLTRQDLALLLGWLRGCRSGLLWEQTFQGDRSTLTLHRENRGLPPSTWCVQVLETGEQKEAQRMENRLKGLGMPVTTVATEWSYIVRMGPYDHYLQAWESMIKIPFATGATVVPVAQSDSRAVFWALIELNPAASPQIVTAPSLAGRKLPVSVIAENSMAEGAVNGGFFSGWKVVGTLVAEGELIGSPYGDRSAVGWNDSDGVVFGRGDCKTSLRIGQKEFPLSRINAPAPQGATSVFTPHFWMYVSSAPLDAIEATVEDDMLTSMRPATVSNHYVTRNGYLVSARGYAGRKLAECGEGEAVSMKTEWADPRFDSMQWVLQAGPLLLRDGERAVNAEGFGPRTLQVRHPRSVVGSDGNKMYFMVIDGRDPWHSRGATIAETAAMARETGLTWALNLDGGGSTTLWWRGALVNAPSGGVERAVPYALVF